VFVELVRYIRDARHLHEQYVYDTPTGKRGRDKPMGNGHSSMSDDAEEAEMLATLALPAPALTPRAHRVTREPAEPSSDELAVFERMQDGDRSSLGELYRRHGSAVYAAAVGVLRSRSDAEEILQDTFVTMWRRRHAITVVGASTLPWLVTTARYLALNRARSAARQRTDGLDDAATLHSRERSPEDEAALTELRSRLDSAIAGLGELDRTIVALCLAEGFTYKEAAVRLGVSQATIRNRLSRVRARLQSSLGGGTEV
jgi:RNA polymerase sigma factor (sigma-70 family)